MMPAHTEEELKRWFRRIDQKDVELPPDAPFPGDLGEMFAWAVGPRAFLVFRDRPDRAYRGIVFHRNQSAIPEVAAMCEWCHGVRDKGGVKLLSVKVDARRRVGMYLCSGLDCVSDPPTLPGPDDLREGLGGDERRARVLRRIADFAARRLY
jgi:hypothetical protein